MNLSIIYIPKIQFYLTIDFGLSTLSFNQSISFNSFQLFSNFNSLNFSTVFQFIIYLRLKMQALRSINQPVTPYSYFRDHLEGAKGLSTEEAAEEVFKYLEAGSSTTDVYGFKFTRENIVNNQNAASFVYSMKDACLRLYQDGEVKGFGIAFQTFLSIFGIEQEQEYLPLRETLLRNTDAGPFPEQVLLRLHVLTSFCDYPTFFWLAQYRRLRIFDILYWITPEAECSMDHELIARLT